MISITTSDFASNKVSKVSVLVYQGDNSKDQMKYDVYYYVTKMITKINITCKSKCPLKKPYILAILCK